MTESQKCNYVFKDHRGKHPCQHPLYHNQATCIFHSESVKEKWMDFQSAFSAWMQTCEAVDSILFYDFRGFIFPSIDLVSAEFLKNADFRSSRFLGDANFSDSRFSRNAFFSDSRFLGDANFSDSRFSRDAYFRRSRFSEGADFSDSRFSRNAYFKGSRFSGDTDFSDSHFSEDADFSDSRFLGSVDFVSSHFSGNAYFSFCHFSGDTFFGGADFQQISYFTGTQFHNVVSMDQARIHFLREHEKTVIGMQFDGAIIDEANFWGLETLEGYSFKNCFLLSLSLANRTLIDCDFTGAVVDAVRTRDWKPDAKTLKNTQFIYTDYTIEKAIDAETGKERTVYKALKESRVPASGPFGVGEHERFTIADYLKERYRWSHAVSLPLEIRTAVLNYFQFFSDFIRLTEGLEVLIISKPEGQKIRVEFQADSRNDKAIVEDRFKTYLAHVQQPNLDHLDIQFSEQSSATPVERKMLEIDLRNQITNLQTKLGYTEALLQSEKEKVQIIQQFKQDPSQLMEESPQSGNLAVLKGDIKSFSEFMRQGKDQQLSKVFQSIVTTHASRLDYHHVSGGDSATLIATKVELLILAAFRIQEDLAMENGNPQLRLALDFGEVDYTRSKGFHPEGGLPLRTAARLEPLVTPGELWCTEAAKGLVESSYRVELITGPQDKLGELNEKGQYSIHKREGNEPEEWVTLYRVLNQKRG